MIANELERATLRQLIDERRRVWVEREKRDAIVWECESCGALFEVRRKRQRFCSRACNHDGWKAVVG